MKKGITVLLTLLVLTMGLTACGGSDNAVVGTQSYTTKNGGEHIYKFNEDGTMQIIAGGLASTSGTYKVNGDTIECQYPAMGTGVMKNETIPFKVDGDMITLVLTNHEYVYTRKN